MSDEEEKVKDKDDDIPKDKHSMRGVQLGGVATRCPKCGQTFYSKEEYAQHVPSCQR
jgi:hypothetical protein